MTEEKLMQEYYKLYFENEFKKDKNLKNGFQNYTIK